jgi:hypothetical protein
MILIFVPGDEGELMCLRRVRSFASVPAERGEVKDSRVAPGQSCKHVCCAILALSRAPIGPEERTDLHSNPVQTGENSRTESGRFLPIGGGVDVSSM